MSKLTPLLLLLALTLSASAEMPRSQRLQRLNQAMDAWRSGGQIWTARIEHLGGGMGGSRGNLYLQFPGKLKIDNDSGADYFTEGDSIKRVRGGDVQVESTLSESGFWILTNGQIGKTVKVEMVAEESASYALDGNCIVADLVIDVARKPKARMRLYISATGTPAILAVSGSIADVWLRDFRQESPKKNPFEHSSL